MLRRLRNAFRPKPALELQIRMLEEMLVPTPTAFENGHRVTWAQVLTLDDGKIMHI